MYQLNFNFELFLASVDSHSISGIQKMRRPPLGIMPSVPKRSVIPVEEPEYGMIPCP